MGYNNELQSFRTRLDTLGNEFSTLQDSHKRLSIENRTLRNESRTLTKENHNLTKENHNLGEKNKSLVAETLDLKTENHSLTNEIQSLQRANVKLSGEQLQTFKDKEVETHIAETRAKELKRFREENGKLVEEKGKLMVKLAKKRALEKEVKNLRYKKKTAERDVEALLAFSKTLLGKRKASDDVTSSNAREPASKKAKRIVVCTQCYAKGLDCDAGNSCAYCVENKRTCKRKRCNTYHEGEGKCGRSACPFAHPEDEFPNTYKIQRAFLNHPDDRFNNSAGRLKGDDKTVVD
ncbi:hypothetical protein P154DRAFT_525890 [Amniculicola lignicola CBS 123094]|uniref:C3H1-type domain-containing protein n=1 Tax=Amniculicola lignicola CBS 123094 TaxID=1392246 RepID=A0A6A5WAA3_9PLEO|nr:hypothetical protein P154DRAFT_525890 [Amniculicola lignicola CBS 123094]